MDERLTWADRLVRNLALEKCLRPVDMKDGFGPTDCGEVFVCGGICPSCAARRYVDRYPKEAPEAVAT